MILFVGHGKKKKKWQKDEPEEAAAAVVPAGPKKEVPKPYMADAKYVTSEFRTTGICQCQQTQSAINILAQRNKVQVKWNSQDVYEMFVVSAKRHAGNA